MNYIDEISKYIESHLGVSEENIKLIILTIISILIIILMKLLIRTIYGKIEIDDKKKYLQNRKMQVTLTIINIIAIVIIWASKLSGLLTLISVVSAAFTIALRDIIFNFFAGIYIRFSKVFSLEDRIEINGLKGDVVNIKALCFELLEVGERVNGEQSTGRIVNVPNSTVFIHPLKNYVKAFKYIWDEAKICVEYESDIEELKNLLYNIISENEILEEIPKKMEDAVEDASLEYRIYYNKLKPIIYTAIVDNHVEVYIRYLVHPKKQRIVQDKISRKVLNYYNEGKIKLFKKS